MTTARQDAQSVASMLKDSIVVYDDKYCMRRESGFYIQKTFIEEQLGYEVKVGDVFYRQLYISGHVSLRRIIAIVCFPPQEIENVEWVTTDRIRLEDNDIN